MSACVFCGQPGAIEVKDNNGKALLVCMGHAASLGYVQHSKPQAKPAREKRGSMDALIDAACTS